jgi:enoyl-CoA hydratase/carnithine racemase
MTTGRTVDAETALRIGLFDEVVPRPEFDAHCLGMAQEIAAAPRDALVGIKAAQRAAFPSVRPDLATPAVASFAETWVADAHWEMVTEAERRRRAAQKSA